MAEGIDFTLHSEAISHFNQKAEVLIDCIQPSAGNSSKNRQIFEPERFIASTFTEEVIRELSQSELDGHGRVTARYIFHKGHRHALAGEGCASYVKLCERLQSQPGIRDFVSLSFLSDQVFSWLEGRFKGTLDGSLMSYLLPKAQAAIGNFEIWIPVAMLYVQSEFSVGNVVIRPISKSMMDSLLSVQEAQNSAQQEETLAFLNQQRKKIQGLAACVWCVMAERNRAEEIAITESEKAIGVLRLFSPANLSLASCCYCALQGSEHIRSITQLAFENGRFASWTKKILDHHRSQEWILDDQSVSMMKEAGLNALGEILKKPTRTRLEDSILDALLLYSRSSILNEVSDKLVYILAGLESILLKSDGEPIQQNLAERMAIVIGQSLEDRKGIVKNVKDLYGIRSRFIHHGVSTSDTRTVEDFLRNSWSFFLKIIPAATRFQTKEEFLQNVDDVKLS